MVKLNKYVVKIEDGNKVILFNYYNGISIKYSKIDFKDVGSFISQEEVFDLLESENFLDLKVFDLQKEMSRTLQLIVLVHEDCNFRCTYCYEKFERGAMKKETGDSVIRYVSNEIENHKEDYDRIQISWFGGEPLLNLNMIEYMSLKFMDIAKQNNIEYSSDITTNGYLLNKKVFSKLIKFNINTFQITIDGTEDYHDKQRILKNGHGTFNRIINNIQSFKSVIPSETCIIVRTNVGKDNFNDMDRHIDNLIRLFGDSEQIYLSFHNIGNWGQNQTDIIKQDIKIELLNKVIDKGGNSAPILWNMVNESICYASKKNHYVIGSTGCVYKCTVALYNAKNLLGIIDKEGNLRINNKKEELWLQDFDEKKLKPVQ
ncbi:MULTISPECIES: radical SAM protein [unclassified Lactococcus]|uniref:radical SAM protein n=1 Tax=unclassified Lactococcus TaxID=2643510 RepID=UPI001E651641|nr:MULTISPECIES: radical SAM protein [unclassified Lactococcus]